MARLTGRLADRLRWCACWPALLIVYLAACQSDGLTPGKQVPLEELYWALELNHHAVTLSTTPPYDTLTLVATPRTIDSAALAGLPAVHYTSSDPERVVVGNDGVLRALGPTVGSELLYVVATLTAGNLKHVDTVMVKIVAADTLPKLGSLSIHPVWPDSAKAGTGGYAQGSSNSTTCFALPLWTSVPPFGACRVLLPVKVLAEDNAPIPAVPVAFRSSNSALAYVKMEPGPGASNNGVIIMGNGLPPGQVTFIASTTIFGRTAADTLPFRIGLPTYYFMTGYASFFPPAIKVGVGATVGWTTWTPDTFAVDITFADPTNVAEVGPPENTTFSLYQYNNVCPAKCGGGNILLNPPLGGQDMAFRRFAVPGTYDYYSSALGRGGRIIVVEE